SSSEALELKTEPAARAQSVFARPGGLAVLHRAAVPIARHMIESSLTDLGAALAGKKISSVELTQLFLDRTAALNGDLNAFITVDPEKSLAQARAADARLAA